MDVKEHKESDRVSGKRLVISKDVDWGSIEEEITTNLVFVSEILDKYYEDDDPEKKMAFPILLQFILDLSKMRIEETT